MFQGQNVQVNNIQLHFTFWIDLYLQYFPGSLSASSFSKYHFPDDILLKDWLRSMKSEFCVVSLNLTSSATALPSSSKAQACPSSWGNSQRGRTELH